MELLGKSFVVRDWLVFSSRETENGSRIIHQLYSTHYEQLAKQKTLINLGIQQCQINSIQNNKTSRFSNPMKPAPKLVNEAQSRWGWCSGCCWYIFRKTIKSSPKAVIFCSSNNFQWSLAPPKILPNFTPTTFTDAVAMSKSILTKVVSIPRTKKPSHS